jgi:hypothetical protein
MLTKIWPILLIITIWSSVPCFADPLPASRRVFSADLDRDGSDEILIAHNTQLSAFRYSGAKTGWSQVWKVDGPGVIQKVLSHPDHPSILIAWGMGKGKMVAPITVTAVEPLSGSMKELWHYKGGRSQVINLQLVQVDKDPQLELFIAHFVSKYHTRRVLLDQLDSDQPIESASGQIRMATSWMLADIDGQPGLEEIIGRVYGDEKGEYGDLSVQKFSMNAPKIKLGQIMPTERGVKSVMVWPSLDPNTITPNKNTLYFSDGWVAAYGKKAKAGLKKLTWLNGRVQVERIADSHDEFTFFELWYKKNSQTGRSFIFAQGNKGINLLTPRSNGMWRVDRLLSTPPIVNAAIIYSGGQWWVALPSEKGTQVKSIKLPNSANGVPSP